MHGLPPFPPPCHFVLLLIPLRNCNQWSVFVSQSLRKDTERLSFVLTGDCNLPDGSVCARDLCHNSHLSSIICPHMCGHCIRECMTIYLFVAIYLFNLFFFSSYIPTFSSCQYYNGKYFPKPRRTSLFPSLSPVLTPRYT